MAVGVIVYCDLRPTPHILLVDVHVLGYIPRGSGTDSVLDDEGVQRWFVLLLPWIHLDAECEANGRRIADTLDRCEVPFFGPLASKILDDE